MNIPRPVLVREGILDSKTVCALLPAQQLFFRNLLHVCDGASRFDADADDLRRDLYRRSTDKVKVHHIQRWLLVLASTQPPLIELYTRSGKAYGRVLKYGQRDTKRKVIHPAPDDEAELPLVSDPPAPRAKRGKPPPPAAPPSDSPIQLNGSEVKEPTPLSDEEWLIGLQRAYTQVNVRAELLDCLAKYPKAGRKFFEDQWLANWEPPMRREHEAAAAIEEPAGFAEWHLKRYDKAPSKSWSEMDRTAQEYFSKLMRENP